ncbi:hypothetical protein BDV38DRAFT_283014 [Aspergillus pseudotamarii]|uniref:Uncharacterized protein n=1 Tax=Aspergillus pseudotamarii TaxID=132259 RepID=A0A5N6SU89_ASPPS|nr:uncharacterized protein BDV38DRAFT_283014 [Aspergillus pseudotamarii]KAE8137467.1 hypothetical protein BDV38DRAFT_283014 [Aspergillus pseudotamarii]
MNALIQSPFAWIAFQSHNTALDSVDDLLACSTQIAITVNGQMVKEPEGPAGWPFVGNFYQIYPDHIANHPLLGIKDNTAIFLGDTETEN